MPGPFQFDLILNYIATFYNRNYTFKIIFNSSQEKAILSTQVLKLEGNMKQMRPLSDDHHQENVKMMQEELKVLREVESFKWTYFC